MTDKEMRKICAIVLTATADALSEYGVGIDELGVPWPNSDPRKFLKSCKGHGRKDTCPLCAFGMCQGCGSYLPGKQVYWLGNCGCYDSEGETKKKHDRRVRALIDESLLLPVLKHGGTKSDAARVLTGGSKKRAVSAIAAEPVSVRSKKAVSRVSEPVAAAPKKAAVAAAMLPIAQAVPMDASINLNLAPGITVEGIESTTTQIDGEAWQIKLTVNVRVGLQGN